MIDFRLPENRRELLVRYSVWQLRRSDVDTALPLMRYIFDRNEYNTEQRLLFCWYYMNTYNASSALALWNEFPDYHLVDIDRLTQFNTDCSSRVPYESDVKWSKYHIPKMFESYRDLVKQYDSQEDMFRSICNGTPEENYWKLRDWLINNLYKCGRYSCFFYMQALMETCNIDIEFPTMHFGHECESPTDGLLYILGRENEATRMYIDDGRKKIKTGVIYPKDMLLELEETATDIIQEVNTRYPDVHLDRALLETILCSVKKLFRRRDGRYLGYYIDRMLKNVSDCEKNGWSGVDYNIVRDWLNETYPDNKLYVSGYPDSKRMQVFLDTGTLPELNMYEDLANV